MKVALLGMVACVVTKSSAVSVSSLPGLATRESVAISPSGLPVLKLKESATAGIAVKIATLSVAMQVIIRRLFMALHSIPPYKMVRRCIREINLSYYYGGQPLP